MLPSCEAGTGKVRAECVAGNASASGFTPAGQVCTNLSLYCQIFADQLAGVQTCESRWMNSRFVLAADKAPHALKSERPAYLLLNPTKFDIRNQS